MNAASSSKMGGPGGSCAPGAMRNFSTAYLGFRIYELMVTDFELMVTDFHVRTHTHKHICMYSIHTSKGARE